MIREDLLFPRIELPIISEEDMEHLTDSIDSEAISQYILQEKQKIREDKIWRFANTNFTNEDETPWEMSPGEFSIYKAIATRGYPRMEFVTSTQYGKTLTVSRALLTRISSFAEDWLVIVPDTKRGRIMLNYMIQDASKNPYFRKKLVGTNLEDRDVFNRLLEEKSKVKLTFQIVSMDGVPKYGSVTLLTAEARRKNNAITTIMGFGGRNIIADESALVEDEIDAGIFRMLAGKGEDTCLIKIGNPFFRNHFLKSWKDKNYKKVFVDYQIALLEGRYNQKFLEEAKGKPHFDVLYSCKFPDQAAIDQKGWIALMTDNEIKDAMQEADHFGEERMGVDPADEGNNDSVIVKRSTGYAQIMLKNDKIDLMDLSGQVILSSEKVNSKRIYVDRVGVGAGVLSRLNEVNRVNLKNSLTIIGINAGEAITDTKYFNKRAEMFWSLRKWIKEGGKLEPNEAWYQLCNVKYKADSAGRLKIMSKEEMRANGINSPDVADALALTFYDPPRANPISEEDKFFRRKMIHNKVFPNRRFPQGK